MIVTKLEIIDCMGISHLVLEPGKVTRIKAPNATGKTSLAKAITSVAKGGVHEAKLIRNGADEARMVFEFDHGAMTAQKRITQKDSDIKMKDERGKNIPKPVSVIQSILNPASVNPISFFVAEKDERKKLILKAMPVQADPARLEAITGQKISATGNAWDVIDALYDRIFEDRKTTKRILDEKKSTVKQLKLAIPEKVEIPAIDRASVTARQQEIDTIKDQKIKAIDNKWSQCQAERESKVSTLRANHEAETADIREKIRVLQQELANKQILLNADIAKADADLEEWKQRASTARTDRTNEWKAARKELDDQLANYDEAVKADGKLEQSRETVAQMEADVEEMQEAWNGLDNSLTELKVYKDELISSLPVPGLEFRGDNLFYTDPQKPEEGAKDWEYINEAKRMQLAVEIALLGAGEARFMFVDGAERLDHKNFLALEEYAVKANAQCITLEVDRDPDAEGFHIEVIQ